MHVQALFEYGFISSVGSDYTRSQLCWLNGRLYHTCEYDKLECHCDGTGFKSGHSLTVQCTSALLYSMRALLSVDNRNRMIGIHSVSSKPQHVVVVHCLVALVKHGGGGGLVLSVQSLELFPRAFNFQDSE